jgi:periplasmic divalent cation tolerance protein
VVKKSKGQVLIVFIISASRREATKLARLLIRNRVAACVNIMPAVRSVFRWKGKTHLAHETLLITKTTEQRYDELEELVRSNHSYEVPEIVAIKVDRGLGQYLEWVKEETSIY